VFGRAVLADVKATTGSAISALSVPRAARPGHAAGQDGARLPRHDEVRRRDGRGPWPAAGSMAGKASDNTRMIPRDALFFITASSAR